MGVCSEGQGRMGNWRGREARSEIQAQGGTAVPAGVHGLAGRSAATGARDCKSMAARTKQNLKEVGLRGRREDGGRRNGPAKTRRRLRLARFEGSRSLVKNKKKRKSTGAG